MKTLPLIAALAILGFSAPGLADSTLGAAVEQGESSGLTINVIVYGDDACPQDEGGEIVVCARHPESERYRIPERLRGNPASPSNQSWSSRIMAIEENQRDNLPTGCSVLSSASGAGCLARMLRQWRAERRLMQSENQP